MRGAVAVEGMLLGVGAPTPRCGGSRRAQWGGGEGDGGSGEGGLCTRPRGLHDFPQSLPVRTRDPRLNPLLRAEKKFQMGGSGDGGTLLPPSGRTLVLSRLLPNTWAAGTICSRTFLHSLPVPTAKRPAALTSRDNVETLLPADPLALGAQPLEQDLQATPRQAGPSLLGPSPSQPTTPWFKEDDPCAHTEPRVILTTAGPRHRPAERSPQTRLCWAARWHVGLAFLACSRFIYYCFCSFL